MRAEGIPVGTVSFTSYLPRVLPAGDSIKDAAGDYATYAEFMDTTYVETNNHWGGLSEVMTIPEEQSTSVMLALRDHVEPLGAALNQGLTDLKTAIDAFGSSMSDFKGTYDALKTRVREFNALPAAPYTSAQKAEATSEGLILPATRTAEARAELVSDLQTARDNYQGYVDTCVSAIDDASPTITKDGPKKLADNIALIKKSYGLATTWVDRGASFVGAGEGRLRFIWKSDAKTLSNFIHEGVPGWKNVHDPKHWMSKYLPDSFKNRIPDIKTFQNGEYGQAMDAWYAKRIQNMSFTAHQYQVGLIMAMPAPIKGALGKLKNTKAGRFLSLNSITQHNGKWRVEINVGNKQTKVPERIRKHTKTFDNAKKHLDKIGESKIVKGAGRGLGVLDVGATYFESYGENYNEELRSDPTASEAELRERAMKSAAVEGTMENVGKVAGGVVGRAAGAAVGQALIPIPGVGAAVGGFVGGIAGEWVGGKLGKGVGEFVNDWRQGGASKALGDAGEALKNVGSTAVEGIKDVSKGIGKKLFGWG